MEYSVYDLVRILVRKWYIVLLTMCLLGGIAMISARQSYQNALTDYEEYTSQTKPVPQETGTLVAVYQYSYEVTDVTKYVNQAKTKADFLRKYAQSAAGDLYSAGQLPSAYDEAAAAFASVSADFAKLLTDPLTMQKTQARVDGQGVTEPPALSPDGTITAGGSPLVLSSHLIVEQLDASTLRLTVSGLDEAGCTAVSDAYLQGLRDAGTDAYAMEVSANQTACDYLAKPAEPTALAQLSQTVMQKPEQMPTFVKIVGTAAAFGFVLACFGVLLFTFIRDTHPKKGHRPQAS